MDRHRPGVSEMRALRGHRLRAESVRTIEGRAISHWVAIRLIDLHRRRAGRARAKVAGPDRRPIVHLREIFRRADRHRLMVHQELTETMGLVMAVLRMARPTVDLRAIDRDG